MPKRRLPWADNARSIIASLVIVLAGYLTAAFTTGVLSLLALLVADAAGSVVIGSFAQLRRNESWRDTWRGAFVFFGLLCGYTLLSAILLGYPLHELRGAISLGQVLVVSAATVLALLLLWRIWPAYGLAAMGARHRRARAVGVMQSDGVLAEAWKLTADNELFFGHGLLAAIALLALAQGALALAGFGMPISPDTRPITLGAYAVAALPLIWVVLQRSAVAVLDDRQRARGESAQPTAATMAADEIYERTPDIAPVSLGVEDLDAMLLRCVRAGQTQLALSALEHGANPDGVPPAGERDQRSALVLAVLSPDNRLLRGFIAKGANLHQIHAGLPLLIAATRDSRDGRPDAVMTLLTNGATPNCADAEGNTPLHHAAMSTTPVVAALLCDAGARIDAINREGQSPLARACEAANWELVRFLLDRGAKIENGPGQPALIAAASVEEDDEQGVRMLLKRKARVDVRDVMQRTALMAAALHGHTAIASALIEAGARVDLADAQGTTALMEAARADAHAVLDVLIAQRPPPDAVDVAGRSALTIAAQSLRAGEETVKRLLALGISRQLVGKDGRRAVECAAAAGRWNIVALIDPDFPRPANQPGIAPAQTHANDSPAHLLDALRFGHWHIVDGFSVCVREWPAATLAQLFVELIVHADAAPRRWLLQHGLDPNTSLEGSTLLQHAIACLPAGIRAARDLVDAGVQPAGTNAIAQLCTGCAADAAGADAQTLALILVDRGAEVFRAEADGRTPLMLAIAHGWLDLAKRLLDGGADPQARDRHGRTPLFSALVAPAAACEAAIKMLLRAGADPEVRASNNETPLGTALARGQSGVQRWLNWPAWKLPCRRLRGTDTIAAASIGDADAVGKLLELGLPVDAVDGYGASALLHAAGRGQAQVVALLLDRGANPAHAAGDGATALSSALAAGHKDIMELLIARGASVDQPLAGDRTALMAAAGRGDVEAVQVLLAHAAQADHADANGMRALHAAAQFAFAGGDAQAARVLFEMLLDAGAIVDARNSDGQTALLILLGAHAPPRSGADQKALLGLLEVLRGHGAGIDVQDERGVGPLHACAMHGLLLPARALLKVGADRSARDLLERTPREVAHRLGFVDVAAELGGDSTRRWAI
ncbi:MAG TPA: ankyrin repeat domain-containing protein [Rudaea sp.]|jgi:ankyrin repeat protein|nr:ankyrin repeat domain-containing protein [Rudaea sp.]